MLRSIPPITSTGPTRSRQMKGSTQSVRIGGIGETDARETGAGESNWTRNIQPVNRRVLPNLHTLPSFRERAKPEVIEDENGVWVIIEFPGHTDISEIEWSENGNILSAKSMLLGCPFQNKIALPANRGKQVEVKLHNGLFIVRFEK